MKMVAEANLILQRQTAAVILARRAAIKAVRQQRKRLGIRETLPYSTLARLGQEWLAAHPELYAEALASPIVQELQHPHRKRRPDRKGELLCESHERNGGQQ
jgi:hypothetical protein